MFQVGSGESEMPSEEGLSTGGEIGVSPGTLKQRPESKLSRKNLRFESSNK